MQTEHIWLGNITALIWGKPSDKVYLCVHGKMSCKENAQQFAEIAEEKGFQTISFDLAEHGERIQMPERCDIWQGIEDLQFVAKYVFGKWDHVSLLASSIGAYFSLNSLAKMPIERCLFHSPISDVSYLVEQMMIWFGITEDRLREEQEIDTPVDKMTWRYYCYVKEHPIEEWPIPTEILYGSLDNLQAKSVIEAFSQRFGCGLTVAENCSHAFLEKRETEIVEQWFREKIM